jgi:hypothetical protein
VAAEEGFPDWADIQLSLYSLDFQTVVSEGVGAERAIYVYPYLGRPKSRGSVSLNPDDLNGSPLIDFNVLSDVRDVKILVEGNVGQCPRINAEELGLSCSVAKRKFRFEHVNVLC